MSPRRRNVVFDAPPPDDAERWIEIPKTDRDRFFFVELRNRGRTTKGTAATLWRWRWIMEAVKHRHPSAVLSPKHKRPITVRSRKASSSASRCRGPVKRITN